MGSDVDEDTLKTSPLSLPNGTPRLVRLAFALAQQGVRGDRLYWALANWLSGGYEASRIQFSPDVSADFGGDDHVCHQFRRGVYERSEISYVAKTVRRGDIVLDIGANFGIYTLLCGVIVGDSGRVIAFEPLPDLATRLASFQPLLPWLEVHNVALGSQRAVMQLEVAKGNLGASSLSRDEATGSSIPVEVMALDELPVGRASYDIGFVKLDVEGAEYEVVRGARSIFETSRVRVALIEFTPRSPDALMLCEWLRGLGSSYSLYTFEYEGACRRRTRWCPITDIAALLAGPQRNVFLVRMDCQPPC